MYSAQEKEALANLKDTVSRKDSLIDKEKAKSSYQQYMTPVLTEVILNAIKNGVELIEPEPPHKQIDIVNYWALEWLKSRIGWAAEQTTEETANMLAEALSQGYLLGESTDQIANRIQQVFENCSDVRAQRIARTEIIMASSEGALEGYQETGIVKRVEFYTALDERTCEDCNAMHTEEFPVEEATGIIPLHPNCRCVWLPVI